MKTLNTFRAALVALLVAVSAAALVNCKGKDGEVGPKGDTGATGTPGPAGPQGPADSSIQIYKNGFIKGTLKGIRRDGTAFEEAFEYTLADKYEGFQSTFDNVHVLDIDRWQDIGYHNFARLTLQVENREQASQSVKISYFDTRFHKELANRDLFELEAQPHFESHIVNLPIARTNNETYQLENYGRYYNSYYDDEIEISYRVYNDMDGNKIYFEPYYDETRDQSGYRFSHIIDANGKKVVTSTVFGNLQIFYNSGSDVFYTSSGTDLSEEVTVPADRQEVTNYAYNPATVLLTFDYKITLDALRYLANYNSYNTTQHALEITGSVQATVYNNVLMRKGVAGY